MFCPQCSHHQATSDTRFCSRCGLSLGTVIDLLSTSSGNYQREKRELTGVAFMMATLIMLFNFLFVYGLVTIPHLANSVFLWIWLGFIISSFTVGGVGLTKLIRSGFFRRMKEREAQLGLMKISTERSEKLVLDSATTQFVNGIGSVTEVTTRELDPIRELNKRQ